MQFQTGDVVQLKSGGPKMTVSTLKDGEVWCVWFDKDNAPQSRVFKPEVLDRD